MKLISFLTIVFALFSISVSNASAQTEILVYPQSDSPLQISNIRQKWRTSNDYQEREISLLTIEYNLQNISDKAIRAYTIREFSREFDTDLGATISSYMLPADRSLEAYQFTDEQLGDIGSAGEKQTFKLAVDFIEFTDGSTWGKDLSNSAQQFAGIKAGIKTVLESIKKSNQQGGIKSVIKILNEMKELTLPAEQNEKRKRGFRIGSNGMKSQLKRAYESGGNKGAEDELQKSFAAYLDK